MELWVDDQSAAEALYGHISTWDTSLVTDMSYMFEGYSDFNDDISQWDVSAVTDMEQMFYEAEFQPGHQRLGCVFCNEHGRHV